MEKKFSDTNLQNLPACAVEFIKQVLRKMRYRKKIRLDVQAELTAHFEDELKACASDEQREQKAQQLIAGFGDVKLLAVLLRRAKKRCRPLWQTVVARTFQTIGVLIVCFIFYVVWFLTGKPVITTDYVAELNRIVCPAADETQNAAPFYHKAAKMFEDLPRDISELLSKKYDEVTFEQKQLMTKWISDNEETLELVISGTQKPYYWRMYGNKRYPDVMMAILMPSLADFRNLARALCWRAQLRAEQGQYDDALDHIKSCYILGQHIKGDKFLIGQLVGFAIEALAVQTIRDILSEHQIDSAALATLQKDFEHMISGEDFAINLEAEKLCMYDEIQRCFTGGLGGGHIIPRRIWQLFPAIQIITALPPSNSRLSSAQKQKPSRLSKFISNVQHEICEPGGFIYEGGRFVKKSGYILFLHPDKQETYQAAQELYDYWENLTVKTPGQIRKEQIDTEKETTEIIKGNILLEMLSPAIGRISELSHRNRVDVEATLAIIAILRYNQETGDYPDNLAKLTEAGFLKALPIDPYSDQPLVYKKTDNNFVLYGVGENFKDDSGMIAKVNGRPRRWGTKDEGDWVFWPVPKLQLKQ